MIPATVLCDFYKISHPDQYPKKTEVVYATWIPRASRIPIDGVVAFGFQAFVKRYLVDYFHEHFFSRPRQDVIAEYERVIRYTLGVEPKSERIGRLHDLGYLPLVIRAVPEGTVVPLRVPMLTIENTHPEFFWVTNYLETLFSCEVWQASTSATIAFQYRRLQQSYAQKTDPDNLDFVPFQGHDFSMRGMSSLQSAMSSGAGHLLSFVGTDTIPAILYAEEYYDADIEKGLVGTSIPATEHSVMCAHGQDELACYRKLVTEDYPAGFISIVSDTWDLWAVLTKVIPSLKDEIMARDGRVVIRPDSGDPVRIVCGDPDAEAGSPAHRGVVGILWDTFGGTTSSTGYKVLDSHIGVIYGDAITYVRAAEICERLEKEGFASTNMVYGIGSFTYQYNTRDTFGFALKSTYARIDGQDVAIFKDPVTDTDRIKKSLTGRCVVLRDDHTGQLRVQDGLTPQEEDAYASQNLLAPIFRDGQILRHESFSEIRSRLLVQL